MASSVTYQYDSTGLSFPRGVGGSILFSSGNLSPGCSTDGSAFLVVGASHSFTDGSWEFGFGSPGVALMQTCTSANGW